MVGAKSHRKTWLHLSRQARLAELMSQVHGSKCDMGGIFTALENSVHDARAACDEHSWGWLDLTL
jgi:hypothetical protein